MSMTLVAAKTYVARVVGGGASQESIDAAGEAILRGYQDWEGQKYWRFLLKDTSNTTAITGITATGVSAVVTAPSTGILDFVNVGQTVTISSGTATLAAGTTVSSVAKGLDGVTTSITLSNAFGGTTNANATLTFSADIPISAGTNLYNLPTDFSAAATGRMISNSRIFLTWRNQEYWDRMNPNQTIRGLPQEFTTYNPLSDLTQNFGEMLVKFDRIPDQDDVFQLRYFRKFNVTSTNIDMPDQYLYKFLDYCRSLLLEGKRAQDDPSGYRDSVIDSFKQAQENDEERNSENDADECIKSQYEMGSANRPLWGNGDFDAFRW
jgi:hypothetical protein